jgi:signal transduction histidine kinase
MSVAQHFTAAYQYPLLDIFLTMFWLFIWILWIFLLIRILMDIFRSDDLSGWGKAAWIIFVILVPFIAVLIYVIVRGHGMRNRDVQSAQAADDAMRAYVQSAAGSSTSTAEEINKLAELRDRGVLSPDEFAAQKAKLLA